MKTERRAYPGAIVALSCLALIFLSGWDHHTGEAKTRPGDGIIGETLLAPVMVRQTIPKEVMDRGAAVYKANCLACHQADGSGNPGMFPPLEGTKIVLGEKEKLIGIVLHGLSGEVEVKGETYYQAMPPQNFLSDQQIADVLTYVRNSFGNKASQVTSGEVKAVRAKKPQS